MAFRQALGQRNSWLPPSHCRAATFKPDILTRAAKSSVFAKFLVCGWLDEMRQVFWVMAFTGPPSTHSAAGAGDRS